uniref:ZP domain-containing protein n=1 Tax=Pygocentrus nattereri TaxID=42514 RepID=A0AAR2IRK8_PYGNA
GLQIIIIKLLITLVVILNTIRLLILFMFTSANDDLTVDCGVSVITLNVNLCTAQWAGFDPANLALNGEHNNSLCQGTIDISSEPPVIRFQLPVNDSQANPCRQSLQVRASWVLGQTNGNQFSTIQSVIITSYIDTPSSSVGYISYSTDLYYHFSCRYPLEYLINNTKIVASSVSVATNDKNGSFINTLSMSVFNLLLDHCFATPSPYNSTSSNKYDFFTGCYIYPHTTVIGNGISKKSRFSFEAFRFVEHRDQDRSSIYLHCILKLCEPDKCQNLINACNGRRKRSVDPGTEASVSVGPIYTAAKGKYTISPSSAVSQPVTHAALLTEC